MIVTIRPSLPSDEFAVAEIEASAAATLRRVYAPRPDARCHLENEGRTIARLVACADGRVVGTLRYWIDGERLHLLGLGVLDDRRRQGVARRMIEHAADIARQAGCRRLSLYTVRQTGNVAVFARLGFTPVAEEPSRLLVSPTGGDLSEVYMEKRLG